MGDLAGCSYQYSVEMRSSHRQHMGHGVSLCSSGSRLGRSIEERACNVRASDLRVPPPFCEVREATRRTCTVHQCASSGMGRTCDSFT
jgi:hypothetical protein